MEVMVPSEDLNHRWSGQPPETVDDDFLATKIEDTDAAGQPVDISLHFLFLQAVPDVFSDGAGRNLVSLDLSSNNIRSLHGLTQLPRLLELKVYSCELTSLDGIEAPRLLKLDASDNRLETPALQSLRKIRSVEVLNVDKNLFTSLDGINVLRLKELDASGNRMRTLGSSLYRLQTLAILHIDDNRLGPSIDPECFRDVSNITELSVRGNLLRDLQFLSIDRPPVQLGVGENGRNHMVPTITLPNLQHLHAQHNEILQIALPPLPHLMEVDLEDNLIAEVDGAFLTALPAVESCYLARNRISKLCGWKQLEGLEQLRELSVLENPWTEGLTETSSRAIILQTLPHLEILDDRVNEHNLPEREERGAVDPLMRCKGSSTRCFAENGLASWHAQQLKTLEAIDAQIQRTLADSESELGNMSEYLDHCEAVMRRENELHSAEIRPAICQDDEREWGLRACNDYHPVESADHRPVRRSHTSDQASKTRRRFDTAKAFPSISEGGDDIADSMDLGSETKGTEDFEAKDLEEYDPGRKTKDPEEYETGREDYETMDFAENETGSEEYETKDLAENEMCHEDFEANEEYETGREDKTKDPEEYEMNDEKGPVITGAQNDQVEDSESDVSPRIGEVEAKPIASTEVCGQ